MVVTQRLVARPRAMRARHSSSSCHGDEPGRRRGARPFVGLCHQCNSLQTFQQWAATLSHHLIFADKAPHAVLKGLVTCHFSANISNCMRKHSTAVGWIPPAVRRHHLILERPKLGVASAAPQAVEGHEARCRNRFIYSTMAQSRSAVGGCGI